MCLHLFKTDCYLKSSNYFVMNEYEKFKSDRVRCISRLDGNTCY